MEEQLLLKLQFVCTVITPHQFKFLLHSHSWTDSFDVLIIRVTLSTCKHLIASTYIDLHSHRHSPSASFASPCPHAPQLSKIHASDVDQNVLQNVFDGEGLDMGRVRSQGHPVAAAATPVRGVAKDVLHEQGHEVVASRLHHLKIDQIICLNVIPNFKCVLKLTSSLESMSFSSSWLGLISSMKPLLHVGHV